MAQCPKWTNRSGTRFECSGAGDLAGAPFRLGDAASRVAARQRGHRNLGCTKPCPECVLAIYNYLYVATN
jgi:hypothetical protein